VPKSITNLNRLEEEMKVLEFAWNAEEKISVRKFHSLKDTVRRRQNRFEAYQGSSAHEHAVDCQQGLVRELTVISLHAAHDHWILQGSVRLNTRHVGLQPC